MSQSPLTIGALSYSWSASPCASRPGGHTLEMNKHSAPIVAFFNAKSGLSCCFFCMTAKTHYFQYVTIKMPVIGHLIKMDIFSKPCLNILFQFTKFNSYNG